ncbi:MAG: SMI1/KNR4 family protein [Blautia wexlerae]
MVLTSGDNYYCVNNENGKVYYWSSSEDSYYYIAESIDEFASFLGDICCKW